MKKISHLLALPLSASLILSGTAIATTAVGTAYPAIAQAQTSDSMVHGYRINKAADSAKYEPELNALVSVARVRHVIHSASGKEKFDKYYTATEQQRFAHAEAEKACFMAKARVSLSILKMEGNDDARALDLAKVGIDLEESKKALPVLLERKTQLYKEALEAPGPSTSHEALNVTSKIASEGYSRLKDFIDEQSGANPPTNHEVNAYSIVNWVVTEKYLTDSLTHHKTSDEDKKLERIAAAKDSFDKNKVEEAGEKNLTMLTTRFGEIAKPEEKNPHTTTTSPSTSSSSSQAPDPKNPDNSETPEPSEPSNSWLVYLFGALGLAGLLATIWHFVSPMLGHIALPWR
ncbi:membrane protein [Corynebacterium kutscheri]|uniref:DUF5129 domain-containing protein n=1 Tax=Corynebacterium kutscheri TaxID=35755 RepID=A0A0F6R1T2_9CORY|nr:hypothetical protein [Corynebacterium kutscheri]AKE42050.1 hypothetical protein UL82_09560 [Corynebacterium kutscheri]VEH10391.1 membrane protein [Corynebacterium kutscheri]VEH82003.1 membrane protein [Corynebacterium kutscheri]